MVGFKSEELEMRDTLINRLLDAVSLEEILDFNDIPEIAAVESLIEASYMSDEDILEQLEDLGLVSDLEEDDDS